MFYTSMRHEYYHIYMIYVTTENNHILFLNYRIKGVSLFTGMHNTHKAKCWSRDIFHENYPKQSFYSVWRKCVFHVIADLHTHDCMYCKI